MPRLTHKSYIKRHHWLKRQWHHQGNLFTILSALHQQQVHAYFVPTKDLTDDQLVAHRRQVTEDQPSLPQAASKLYVIMANAYLDALDQADDDPVKFGQAVTAHRQPDAATTTRTRKGSITVTSLARPEPDEKGVIRVLLDMARQTEQKRRQDRGRGGEAIG